MVHVLCISSWVQAGLKKIFSCKTCQSQRSDPKQLQAVPDGTFSSPFLLNISVSKWSFYMTSPCNLFPLCLFLVFSLAPQLGVSKNRIWVFLKLCSGTAVCGCLEGKVHFFLGANHMATTLPPGQSWGCFYPAPFPLHFQGCHFQAPFCAVQFCTSMWKCPACTFTAIKTLVYPRHPRFCIICYRSLSFHAVHI